MNLKKLVKYIILIICYLVLIWGLYTGLLVATGKLFTIFSTLVNCLFPALACYSFLFFPLIVIIMVRLHGKKKRYWLVPIVFGLVVTSLNVLPLVAGIQKPIIDGEAQFAQVFGSDYMDKIPQELKAKFMDSPFDFWDLYNHYERYDCNITYNVPYLTIPIYNDVFYFDYYCPRSGTGPFPTIINIHGGGWAIGNKGFPENRPHVNMYLASQGYCIFDIQYGLAHFPNETIGSINLDSLLSTVQGTLGRALTNKSYPVVEQIVHVLGNFTNFLVNNASQYNVNLSCVYVTGNSAGGHLTECFIGWNTTYRDIFPVNNITIRGLIPFYGVSNLADMMYMASDPLLSLIDDPYTLMVNFFGGDISNSSFNKLISPVTMLDDSAPPILLLHGMNDELVPVEQSRQLKAAYDANASSPCILIEFPFVGHAFDYIYNSPGGQISLYFIERFLAATRYA
ncbi:MAG: prolyl oligopeptidase family serine peptidase [Candidatus Helarchaeota archaeon]